MSLKRDDLKLEELGFEHLGFGWYQYDDYARTERIRLWNDNEVILWKWHWDEDMRQIVFQGKIEDQKELLWVFKACFDNFDRWKKD